MKAYWGSEGIAPHILDLGTRWRWVVSFMPWPLYPQYPLDRRLGGLQNHSGHDGEEKNYQPLPGLEPLIIQPVAQCYTTELSQLILHCHDSLKFCFLHDTQTFSKSFCRQLIPTAQKDLDHVLIFSINALEDWFQRHIGPSCIINHCCT
jgi:hypothetical protein